MNPLILELAASRHDGAIPGIEALGQRGIPIQGVQNAMAVARHLIDLQMDSLPPNIAHLHPLRRDEPTPFFTHLLDAVDRAQRANFGEEATPHRYGWFCPEHNTQLNAHDVNLDPNEHPTASCWTDGNPHIVEPIARALPDDAPDAEPDNARPLQVGDTVTIHRLRPNARDRFPIADIAERWTGHTARITQTHALYPDQGPGDQQIRLEFEGQRQWFFRDEVRRVETIAEFRPGARVRLRHDIENDYDIEELLEAGAAGTISHEDTVFTARDWQVNFDEHGPYTVPEHTLEIIR